MDWPEFVTPTADRVVEDLVADGRATGVAAGGVVAAVVAAGEVPVGEVAFGELVATAPGERMPALGDDDSAAVPGEAAGSWQATSTTPRHKAAPSPPARRARVEKSLEVELSAFTPFPLLLHDPLHDEAD
jgi:hypothetical protein